MTRLGDVDINENQLWWNGPQFLHEDNYSAPKFIKENDCIQIRDAENGRSVDIDKESFYEEVKGV